MTSNLQARAQIIAALLCWLLTTTSLVYAADQPNVVLVITDDQGYGDLSCHGNPVIKTPALDALYAESIRFTDYHVSPTCSPTRAALLTGHWTNRTGVWHTIMGRSMLRENEVTMGNVFSDAGYATGMFGKWHLGDNYPYRAEDRGFQEVMRHGGGGVGQTPDYWDNSYFDGTYWHNGHPTPVKGYCTDVFFDYAMQFIDTQAKQHRPFFAYIATNAPHGPMHVAEEYSAPYAEQGTHVANFFGMIANIDENVGRLRSFLKDRGLDENTIFIYTTDNGSSSGFKIFNAGMRAGKGSEFDGGHRVPYFIRWPAGELTGPRDIAPLTAHVDILPTLIDLCGIQPPSVKFDGRSLVPLLRNSQAEWPDRILVTDSQRVKDPIKWKQSAVMTSQWRLINGKQLYDIKSDPGQTIDVASGHPQVVERLRDFYESWWQELEPSFANETPIYLGDPHDNPARLTSHDWITTSMTPWNQSQVRAALTGSENTGFWNVLVTQPGEYSIRLRRWPKEMDLPITSAIPAGLPVPGEKAFRLTPGKSIPVVTAHLRIANQQMTQSLESDASEVEFIVSLPAGRTKLDARFTTTNEQEYGAYFVYVERLSSGTTKE